MTDLILVDENDKEIGIMEKIEAHKKGLLHRAFSGFVFNDKKELLIQQRDLKKYHNGGKWANTVCSHPYPNEKTKDGIERRIFEELGFKCEFKEIGSFKYKISFDNGLTENEYDHVFIGKYNSYVKPNPLEVMNYKWIKLEDLKQEILDKPDNYTFWLKKILELKFLEKNI